MLERWRRGWALVYALSFALFFALGLALPAAAQAPSAPPTAAEPAAPSAEPRLAADLREEVRRLSVTVPNAYGREFSGSIAVTWFRPPGEGPFPLAVVSHGRAIAERRAQQGRQRFEPLARYLVGKGFAVAVPTRLGYGDTYGQADPEAGGACAAVMFEGMSRAAAEQVLATVAFARSLPWVDASRWVAIGQSVGGMATVSLAWRKPPGLVAAINFAGGAGGNPQTTPREPCSPRGLESLWRSKAPEAAVPMLWLYWRNDLYWGEDWPQRWARAWREGDPSLQFHLLDAVGADGHSGMSIDMNRWVPLAEAFLARLGFGQRGSIERPPATGFAALDDVDSLPAGPVAKELYSKRFLAAKPPRAFAIGPQGASGWATGDWAMGHALGFCQARRGVVCRLYAVDDDVVWVP